MRTLRPINQELAEAKAYIDHADQLQPTHDNEGNLMTTAADRVASYRARYDRLLQERQRLLDILGTNEETE